MSERVASLHFRVQKQVMTVVLTKQLFRVPTLFGVPGKGAEKHINGASIALLRDFIVHLRPD